MSERQRDGGVASSENRRGDGQGPGQATELSFVKAPEILMRAPA